MPLTKKSSIYKQSTRGVKVAVWITGYNEGYTQLLTSVAGVFRNYYELVEKDKDYMDKVTLNIIYDGYEQFMKAGSDEKISLQEQLSYIGLFDKDSTQDFFMQQKESTDYSKLNFLEEEGKEKLETNNVAHWFSKRMSMRDFIVALSPEERHELTIDGYSLDDYMLGSSEIGHVKNQVFTHLNMDVNFVIKHLNRGKIESHLWYFKGFCQQLNPEFCFIIDAGTVALWNSISRIVFYMEAFPQVGGASGEIECMLPEKNADGSAISWIQSILMRAQYLEYKISHYSDKAAESLFGFVSVLPGAFSAFRWEAVKGDPLKAFLKGQSLTDTKESKYNFPSWFSANMYLAEDRIMWLELVIKKHHNYIIKFIPGCKALTDVPTTLNQLIKQRRRWFNGSLFATFYVFKNICKIWPRRRKSWCRNVFLSFLYLYMIASTILGYFLVAIFYASFSIFARSSFDSNPEPSLTHTANLIENFYMVSMMSVLVLWVGVKIEYVENFFLGLAIIFGAITIFMIVCMVQFYMDFTFSTSEYSLSLLFIGVVISSYIIPLVTHLNTLRPVDFLKGVVYSIMLTPTFINIIVMYAICNIHDVSWGSRPSGAQATKASEREDKMEASYKNYRSWFLLIWLVANISCGYWIIYLSRNEHEYSLFILSAIMMVILGIKIILSILHMISVKVTYLS